MVRFLCSIFHTTELEGSASNFFLVKLLFKMRKTKINSSFFIWEHFGKDNQNTLFFLECLSQIVLKLDPYSWRKNFFRSRSTCAQSMISLRFFEDFIIWKRMSVLDNRTISRTGIRVKIEQNEIFKNNCCLFCLNLQKFCIFN